MSRSKKAKMDSQVGDFACLPEEIVIEIFKLLDTASLLQVVKTCKLWKTFVDKFIDWKRVTISAERADDIGNFSTLTRKVSSARICGDFTIGSRFVNLTTFLRRAGVEFTGNLKNLELKSMTIRVKILASILRMFPNLEEVKLINVITPPDDADTILSDIEKPVLGKLKKLVFKAQSSSLLLSCFEKARISVIEGTNQTFIPNFISLFLAHQPELTDIDFCRLASHQLCLVPIVSENIPFKLKRLALDYVSMTDFREFISLLRLQIPRTCVETLEVGHIPAVFYKFIFTSLSDLKTLHLIPGCVGQDVRFSISLRTNQKITTLRLYDGIRYGLDPQKIREVGIKVIDHLPNLETLELLVPYDVNFFNAIDARCKKLKSLTILIPFYSKLSRLKIPATVENLRIKCFNGEETWIHDDAWPTHQQVPPGPGWPKSLIFEGVTDKMILTVIARLFPNLESLELRKKLAGIDYASFMNEHAAPKLRGVKYRDEDFFIQKVRF